MKIHIGELINLITNSPVADGHTISHGTMKSLIDTGIAIRDPMSGETSPTDKGKWIYNQLTCKTVEVEETYSFKFGCT